MLDAEHEIQNLKTKGLERFHFCTYFDQQFLLRGLALYRSLLRNSEPFKLYILCLDNATFEFFNRTKLPHILAISLKEFESGDEDLLEAKKNRSQIEYYFTCTSSFLIYILRRFPEIDLITYLDADLFFYSRLTPIFEEMGGNSILIIPHRFPDKLKSLEIYGIYNVGFLCFRNDKFGMECLSWWRDRCIEWCHDRTENGLFADQKYLDEWPTRFKNVVILQHRGAGLAPWNVDTFRIERKKGFVFIDSQPLIYFHFHRLRIINSFYIVPNEGMEKTKLSTIIKKYIYYPYLKELKRINCKFGLKRFGLSRYGKNYNMKNLFKLFVFGYSILFVGPLTVQIRQEYFIRPMFYLKRLRSSFSKKNKISN